MSISVLLVSCAQSIGNDTTSINQLETSSIKDDTSVEVISEQLSTEEITIGISNEEKWNSPEEGETLCYEKYSDEQFDEMGKHFEDIMSEEMLDYYKNSGSGWIAPSKWECLLLGEMELNLSVDNEIYSIKLMQYEVYLENLFY